jgi:SAM-dependent methyltransferase
VDAEPDMIDIGRRKAAGIATIFWTVQAAEDVRLPPGSLDLVTVGNAFHRLDRPRIAAAAFTWLRPGAPIAVVDTASVWRGTEPWQRRAVEVIAIWAPRPPAVSDHTGPKAEDFLRGAGFRAIEEFRYPTPHRWTVDTFLGYLFSTSVASRRALGSRAATFDAEMRRALRGFESEGGLTELVDFRCVLGRRS